MTNPNQLPNAIDEAPTVAGTTETIQALSNNRVITRDQERIGISALKEPAFALMANRLINQGSDPESFRLVDPNSFEQISKILGLTVEQGTEAIAKAHRQGPASLKEGSTEEALWLLLASVSANEFSESTLADRIVQFGQAIATLRAFATQNSEQLRKTAADYQDKILKETQPIGHTPEGVPIYDKDLGFFAAYRSGIRAAIVQTPEMDFVGTVPETTLEEQGLPVDKKLSDQFGLRFKR